MKKMTAQYTPTQWSTADDKARFVKQFQRFVLSDFQAKKFPKWFYKRLSMTFGHIALYNRDGFYSTYFTTTKGKVDFLTFTLAHQVCGDPAYTFSDVERELRRWLRDIGIVERCQQKLNEQIETAERQELTRLQAKYSA